MIKQSIAALLLGSLSAAAIVSCIPDDPDGQGEMMALPVVTIGGTEVAEGSDGVYDIVVPVTLEGTLVTTAVVDYRTVSGTALSGDDFTEVANGKLFFNPGEDSKAITIGITGDNAIEEDEEFTIELYNPRNLEIGEASATIRLTNDDRPSDLLNIPTEGYSTPERYPERTMLWSDEFDGERVDATKWTFEIGTGNNGWGNNELQYYREENTIVTDGSLVIQAKKEDFGGSEYTSSRLISMDKREFEYGRIDIRAALPEGQGMWPALWMLGANFDEVGWPSCGEIDIMEALGDDTRRVLGTAHYGVTGNPSTFRTGRYDLGRDRDYVDEWHVYSLIWSEDSITWLVDDVEFHSLTPAETGNAPWPFNNPFFMIMNVAVGGQLPGNPDATTIFPQRMAVDYIRVFQ